MKSDDPFRLSVVMGAVLMAGRQARGLTQQELAQRSGLHPMALSKIERGVQSDIGVETVSRIAAALTTSGAAVSGSELLAMAERWQTRLRQLALEEDDKSVPGNAGSGAKLAAVILLLLQKGDK